MSSRLVVASCVYVADETRQQPLLLEKTCLHEYCHLIHCICRLMSCNIRMAPQGAHRIVVMLIEC